MSDKSIWTVGDIARARNTTESRVKYWIANLRIEPAERVGVIRAFSREQAAEINRALDRADQAAAQGDNGERMRIATKLGVGHVAK